MIDLFKTIKESRFKMEPHFREVTMRIKQTVMQISDDLHKILETYKEHLGDVEGLLQVVIQAIGTIPSLRLKDDKKKRKN